MHPVIIRHLAAGRPAATPIKNADRARKENEK